MSVKIDQTCKHKHHPIFKIYLYTNTNTKVFQDRKANKICKTLAIVSNKIIFAKTIDFRFFRVYNADKFQGCLFNFPSRNGAQNNALQNKRNSIRVFLLLLLFRREINSRSDFCCAEKGTKKVFSRALQSDHCKALIFYLKGW